MPLSLLFWALVVLCGWLVAGLLFGLVFGRVVRIADAREVPDLPGRL